MSDYKLAGHYFSSGDYRRASTLYLSVIGSGKYGSDEIRDSFSKLISISNLEKNQKFKIEILLMKAEFHIREKEYSEGNSAYQTIINIDPDLEHVDERPSFYTRFLSATFKSGQIEDYLKISEKYLDYCLTRRLIDRGLQYFDGEINEIGFYERFVIYHMKFLIWKNDIVQLSSIFQTFFQILDKDFEFKKTLRKNGELKDLIRLMNSEKIEHKLPWAYSELLIREYIDTLVAEHELIGVNRGFTRETQRVLIKTFVEAFITSNSKAMYSYLLTFYKLTKNVSSEKRLEEIVKNQKISIQTIPGMELSEKDNFRESVYPYLDEKFDLAIITGDPAPLAEVRDELKNEKSFRMDLKQNDLISQFVEPGKDYSRVADDLITVTADEATEDVSSYNELFKLHENELIQNLLSGERSYKELKDIYVLFMMLELHKAARLVLDRVKKTIPPSDLISTIEVLHMEATLHFELSEYTEALCILDHMINTYRLTGDERICFHYLRAEILMKQRRHDEARSEYMLVYRFNQNYRLVKERLRELAR